MCSTSFFFFSYFFFNDTATTEIYTLSLHDALPISPMVNGASRIVSTAAVILNPLRRNAPARSRRPRSEEHTSELQSLTNLVCRLLLEKKKKKKKNILKPIHKLSEYILGYDHNSTST